VKLLEDAEVGRPSTYATILSTIQDRGYVEKKTVIGKKVPQLVFDFDLTDTRESPQIQQRQQEFQYPGDTNRFYSTEVGRLVHQFIHEHCQSIIHPEFTKNMEKQLDNITNGSVEYISILNDFYPQLLAVCNSTKPATPSSTPSQNITNAANTANTPEEIPQTPTSPTKSSAASQKKKRSLGNHPTTNLPIFVYRGKFGPVVQMGGDQPPSAPASTPTPTSTPTFVKLPASLSITNCSLSDVLPLFAYPRVLGQFQNMPITLKKGKFGLYLVWNGKNYSARQTNTDINTSDQDDPEFTLEMAIQSIQSLPPGCVRKINDSISVYNGKYGYSIQWKRDPSSKTTNIPFKQYTSEIPNEEIMEYVTATASQSSTKPRTSAQPKTKKKSVHFSTPLVDDE
jgi:DNA topoisomerase-1